MTITDIAQILTAVAAILAACVGLLNIVRQKVHSTKLDGITDTVQRIDNVTTQAATDVSAVAAALPNYTIHAPTPADAQTILAAIQDVKAAVTPAQGAPAETSAAPAPLAPARPAAPESGPGAAPGPVAGAAA